MLTLGLNHFPYQAKHHRKFQAFRAMQCHHHNRIFTHLYCLCPIAVAFEERLEQGGFFAIKSIFSAHLPLHLSTLLLPRIAITERSPRCSLSQICFYWLSSLECCQITRYCLIRLSYISESMCYPVFSS